MKFNTPYDRTHSKLEVNSGQVLVETAGYIDKKTRIENLIRAGNRLNEIRTGYDAEGDFEDIPIDPTRSKSFDLVDAKEAIDKATETTKRLLRENTNNKASNDVTSKKSKEVKTNDEEEKLPDSDKKE